MNAKKLTILALFLATASMSQAQYPYLEDGLRISQSDQGSTARFKAMGNAQTALGGDLSSIAGNPAGLGYFNNSDASISFDFINDGNQSTYYSNSSVTQQNKLGFNQVGVVFNFPTYRGKGQNLQTGWLNFNVGVSYNKTQDFKSAVTFMGENDASSYTDMLADESGRDDIFYDWGYKSYLVDHNGDYYYPTTSEEYTNNQKSEDFRSGFQHQTSIAFGANYSNQFYIGASVGIAGFEYKSNRTFSEVGIMKDAAGINYYDPESEFLDPTSQAHQFLDADYELLFTGNKVTRGSGVNATLGMIFTPTNMIRIGVSATTPTWYQVTEDYSMYLDTRMVDPDTDADLLNYEAPQEDFYDEYTVRTPYKLNAGIAAIFEQGLISADVEYVDYTSIRINDEDYTSIIQDKYKGTANLRIGGEYRFSPEFLVRAGYNYKGSPYKDTESIRQTASAGLGYRVNNYYIDLAYQNQNYSFEYTPYQSEVNPTQAAKIDNSRNNIILTLGVKF